MSQKKSDPVRETSKSTALKDRGESIPATALEQAGVTPTTFHSRSIDLHEMTGTALVKIHSLRSVAELNEALVSTEIRLPSEVNQSLGQDPAIICLAPGEWLFFSEYLRSDRLFKQLQTAIDPEYTSALNLTAALTVFRLSGKGVPWLLNKLSGLDFQAGKNSATHAARTRLQHAAVTLHYHPPASHPGEYVFDLIVDRGIASYVWQLLIASIPHAEELAQEFDSDKERARQSKG